MKKVLFMTVVQLVDQSNGVLWAISNRNVDNLLAHRVNFELLSQIFECLLGVYILRKLG